MVRVRRWLRSWRRTLDWVVLEPTGEPLVYTVRLRLWHPGLWLRVAAALWREGMLPAGGGAR